jgi:CheY-like chemotaxis protein
VTSEALGLCFFLCGEAILVTRRANGSLANRTKRTKKNVMSGKRTPIILVIEDYSDSRVLLSSLLRSKGYKVIEAKDGKEGMLQANRVIPDLILMDLAMPEMDGVEATRQLRKRQVLSNTPIFAISAYATTEVKQDAIATGCTEVFPKPLDVELLLGRIKERVGA